MKQITNSMKIILMLIFLATSMATPFALANTVGLDSIVAVVNDKAITNSQLVAQIQMIKEQLLASHAPVPPPAVLRKKVLNDMIDTQLQMQIAKKAGVEVTDAMVNEAISHIAEQNGLTVAELPAKLKEQGMDYARYRKEIHDQILLSQIQQKAVTPDVKISDQEVADFVATHGKELSKPAATEGAPAPQAVYQIQAVIVPVPETATAAQVAAAKAVAQKALEQLKVGTTPQALVTSELGVKNNLQQSDLGWRNLSQLPDLYMSYVRDLQPGNIAGPIHAPNGFHLLKLVAVRGNNANASPALKYVETHVRHILIKTTPLETDTQVKVRLERLRANILGGEDFSKAAMENSQDQGSVGKGGDLGWVTPGVLVPAFETVMNQTKPGQISQPFKSQFGWHILQVLDRRSIKDNEALRRQRAKEIIFQRKYNEALQRWLHNMRNAEYVKIFEQ